MRLGSRLLHTNGYWAEFAVVGRRRLVLLTHLTALQVIGYGSPELCCLKGGGSCCTIPHCMAWCLIRDNESATMFVAPLRRIAPIPALEASVCTLNVRLKSRNRKQRSQGLGDCC